MRVIEALGLSLEGLDPVKGTVPQAPAERSTLDDVIEEYETR